MSCDMYQKNYLGGHEHLGSQWNVESDLSEMRRAFRDFSERH